MVKVTMPQLGESVAEGTIGKWLKQPGDHVAKYEPLLEVITDKVNAEVPSPFEGVLKEILVQEGETVPNNAEIAVIDEVAGSARRRRRRGGSAPARCRRPAPRAVAARAGRLRRADRRPAPRARRRSAGAARPAAAARAIELERPRQPGVPTATPGDADARMTPAVRRLLREHGLTAAQIVGTGGGGRITREDVLDFVEAARTGQPSAASAPPRPRCLGGAPVGTGIGRPRPRSAPPAAPRPRRRRSSSRPAPTKSSSR